MNDSLTQFYNNPQITVNFLKATSKEEEEVYIREESSLSGSLIKREHLS